MGTGDNNQCVIKIMTIHQAKGLEFPVVILADLDSKIPNNMDQIVFDKRYGLAISHTGTELESYRPINSINKKRFPTNADKIKHLKYINSESELFRLMYVALTRASEYVYIVESDKLNIKNKNNLSSLIERVKKYNKILLDKLLPNGFVVKRID